MSAFKRFWGILGLFAGILAMPCHADAEPFYPTEAIVNAIYHAEGGSKTRFPYGIVSINTHGDKELARRICANTVNKHRKRHARHNCGMDFISCLQKRYCPVGAENDNGTNRFWKKNVLFYLERQA